MKTETAVRVHPFDASVKAGRPPYKVKSLVEAESGRSEIRLAEQEMPGLAVRAADLDPIEALRHE